MNKSLPMTAGQARVAVVYALPEVQTLIEVPYHDGMTAAEAVDASGITARVPAIAGQPLVLGIHGVEVGPTQQLAPGDRVEICRPLVADPRRMRFEKVAQGRTMARGDPDDS
jgi:hypothetical protein